MSIQIEEISPSDFEATWLPSYEKIFSGGDLHGAPFVNPRWQTIAVGAPAYYFASDSATMSPVERRHRSTYEALISAAQNVSDNCMVLALREGNHLNASTFINRQLSLAALYELCIRPMDGFDRHIFGPSSSWGLVISWEEEIGVLGGEEEFVQNFVRAAGGRAALRDDFLECSEYLVEVSEHWANVRRRLADQSK